MAFQVSHPKPTAEQRVEGLTNGAALAAFAAAGFGSFALGMVVLLNEAGVFAAPAIYGPAGGVSGRTTLAVVLWLVAWVLLHRRWKNLQLDARRISVITLILIVLGVVATFPPVWGVF